MKRHLAILAVAFLASSSIAFAQSGSSQNGTGSTSPSEAPAANSPDTSRESPTASGSTESTSQPDSTTQRDSDAPPSISPDQQAGLQSAFRDVRVEPIDIEVDVSIGASLPASVTLSPLPPRIVEIVPAYEDYQYFMLADGRIVIVEPTTMEVVYIVSG